MKSVRVWEETSGRMMETVQAVGTEAKRLRTSGLRLERIARWALRLILLLSTVTSGCRSRQALRVPPGSQLSLSMFGPINERK